MLVKKINPNWTPVENNALQVGETIEITDPKALVLNGDVVAINEDGTEKSSYDMFGVLAGKEKTEFEQWLAVKKQKELQEKLVEESKALKEEVATAIKKEETPVQVPVVVAEKVPATPAKTEKKGK